MTPISIAMPYWCRQPELDRSLAAYRATYPGWDLEISICDDGSPEPVRAPGCVISSLPRKDIGKNPCVPMNVAVRASTRDVVVITNPEIEHTEDAFSPMLALLQGPLDVVNATCRDADGTLLAGEGMRYERALPPGAHLNFCMMFHRQLFEAAGGFDERFREGRAFEDADFLWRLHAAGARFHLTPALVRHYRTPHARAGCVSQNARLYDGRWSRTA